MIAFDTRQPLSPTDARRLIREILVSGEVVISRHAAEEMAKDALTLVDCVSVLRAGVVLPGEMERGSWRYRVHAHGTWVVVSFRSESRLVIVTAWRSER